MTSVSDLMSSSPTVRPAESLATAAKALWEGACSGVPVVDDEGRLAGFVTERDVAMCGAIEGRSLHELLVAQAMTARPGLSRDASLAQAHDSLREQGSERLPVVGDDDRVVGVLDFAALVRDAQARPSARKAAADVKQTLAVLSGVAESGQANGASADRARRPTAKHALKTTTKAAATAAPSTAAKSAAKAPAKKAAVKKGAAKASAKKGPTGKAGAKTAAGKTRSKKASGKAGGKGRTAGA